VSEEQKVYQPNGREKKRARTGYYETFDDMPRLVREWAKANGYRETAVGVYGPIGGGQYIDELVRESLTASNGRKRRWL